MELSYHVLSREGTLSLARWAMSDTDKVFAGSIPEIYDAFLVPLIFEGFADDLARRVASGTPRAVLETAAGSGVLTRALAGRMPPNAQYVASDLNQPMLDQASRRQDNDERITWQQANALSLPFPDRAGRISIMAAIAAAVVGMVHYWPQTSEFWRIDVWWHTETAREGMGMMIVLVVLAISYFAARARSQIR